MAKRVAFHHHHFRSATVYVDGERKFFGSYMDGVHFYEVNAFKLRDIKELNCVVCGGTFDKPRYRFKLTCSQGCRGIHTSQLNKKQ